jgi:hypothetical protein
LTIRPFGQALLITGTPQPPRGSAAGWDGDGGGVAKVVDSLGGGMMWTGDLGVCISDLCVVVVVVDVVSVVVVVVVVVEVVVLTTTSAMSSSRGWSILRGGK